ncbi:MAG: chitobiase/beta-hexosaminidase C-terminal domain-containing protein [Labilithrix sp.]|nr:chitobiase/beta-hexosaminidase C-terminal domain-containing protein [Labilithrix sp.]MCW5809746.1 chitobiase/beta-hexosaminidase C-terminal domain-containing protein [Labilithrix sp.]
MLKRFVFLLVLLLTVTLGFFACGGSTTNEGGLVVIITTDLSIEDMNAFRVEISQEVTPGTFGEPLIAKDYRMPADATLPATITIAAGTAPSQNALVRVIGRKIDAAGDTPIVLREAEVRVPSDRVLALTMVLSAACAYQVEVDPSGRYVSTCPLPRESCQPATGLCGSSIVDVDTLPPYDQVAGRDAALPIVPLDGSSVPAGPGAKEILSFAVAGVTGTIAGSDIFVSLPPGTNDKGLVPTIKWSGAKIEPDPSVAQDFDKKVLYTVTAADGSERVYTVHVSIALPDTKRIESFVVPGAVTLYTFGADEIDLEFPYGATPDLKNLVPTIAFVGKSISPASLQPQDFTNPVTYTVTAYDGSTRDYTVTAVIVDADAAEIRSFKINGVEGMVSTLTESIDVKLETGADLTNLTPEIQWIGKTIDPPAGTAQNFTSPVTYTVTSGDGTKTARYAVTVTRPRVSNVTFSPLGGNYGHTIDVKLSCKTPGAEVRFTTDASEPTASSTLYTPGAISIGATVINRNVKARCFSSRYEPAQITQFQLYSVTANAFDGPDEVTFGPTKCGQQAAAKTFSLSNTGAATTYSSDTPASFTVAPASGSIQANATITVTPKPVPAAPDSLDDIAETVNFTFAPNSLVRTVTLRQTITCP